MMVITAIDRGQVLAVLEREGGVGLPWVTVDVIVDALGWTAESARATLDALVRGGEVELSWRDGEDMSRPLPRPQPDVAPLDVRGCRWVVVGSTVKRRFASVVVAG
jgi:hypothetical protein